MADNEIMIVDERTLKDKVYNIKKFDADFRFKLSKEEWSNLKSKILTPSWGGRRTIPYAFTER